MYKIVVTILMVIAMGAAGHAAFHTTQYTGPAAYSYGSGSGYLIDSSFSFNYAALSMLPAYQPIQRSPSDFNFAYSMPSYTPNFGTQRTFSDISLNAQPMDFTPSYGSSLFSGDVALNVRPTSYNVPYSTRSFGSLGFALPHREIPLSGGSFIGGWSYSYTPQYVVPVYATPSRAQFNTEFGFGMYGPYYYEA